MSLKAQLSLLPEIITSQRSLKFHPYDPNQATSLSQQMIDVEGRQFNVIDFIKEYVGNMDEDDTIKSKLIASLTKLYTVVSEQEIEKKSA